MNSVKLTPLLLLLFIGCKSDNSTQQMPLTVVEVADADQMLIPDRIEYIGEVSSNYDATIQPRVDGYITMIGYDYGMPVEKGKILYKIDPKSIETQISSSKAAVLSAEAQLVEARNNYNRALPLSKIDAISKSSLDEYEAIYRSAEANLQSATAALDDNKISYGYTTIVSPIDGIIGYSDLVVGQYVGPSSSKSTLNTISNIDKITVSISIPLSQYLTASSRDSMIVNSFDNSTLLSDIQLTLADGTKYPYEGRYRYTKKEISTETGSVVIVVEFDNPNWILKIGQYVKVEANLGDSRSQVVVPQIAVSQSQGINSLWVISSDSTAEYRKVGLGKVYGDKWIVSSGVNAGERVVINGQMRLKNGEKVKIKTDKKG